MLSRSSHWLFLATVSMAGAVLEPFSGQIAQADDLPKSKVDAPKGQDTVGRKLGGFYFAPRPLREQYEALVAQVKALEKEIIAGRISGRVAGEKVRTLKAELERVRAEIDAQKSFVPSAKIDTRSETTTFDLGSERTLYIAAGNVRLIGWDQPGIKCVLDKTVLSAGDQPVDDDFKAIQLVHRHERGTSSEVGRSQAEIDADEEKFLASPDGQKLDAKQREWRKNFIDKMIANSGYFGPLQGKEIDIVTIDGLTADQGNAQIAFETLSPGGGGMAGSLWRRHAALTVYLPECKAIGLRGGCAGLDVQSVRAPLIIWGDGNRDYDGTFRVRDHEGALTSENVPIQSIENVRGDVSITVSVDTVNSGMQHDGNGQTAYFAPPEEWNYRNIEGNLTVLAVKADLHVAGIAGRIDVNNEFGDTVVTADKPLAAAAHRIVSQGGNIEVQVTDGALAQAPLAALTQCGMVRVPDKLSVESIMVSGWPGAGRIRRGFHGFAQKRDGGFGGLAFQVLERISQMELGEDRPPGLDVLSRGGTVRITIAE
ncbi:MAG: hypothetical protein HYX69_06450 [Planctomycetia bacterium]|nr:hypothetical protein [Planctomycetia bacterium]